MNGSLDVTADVTGQRQRSAIASLAYRWPVAASALAALVDLGMSDDAIARYFAVEGEAVRALRQRHRIRRGAGQRD